MHESAQPGVLCAPAKPTIRTRKRMRASRGAAPKRPTELRQAVSESGVVKLTIRARIGCARKTRRGPS